MDELQVFRSRLLDIFEQTGIVVDGSVLEQDTDLRDYVEDSVQFISAIVEIESQFDIELPDELLLYDSLASFQAFSMSVWEVLQSSK